MPWLSELQFRNKCYPNVLHQPNLPTKGRVYAFQSELLAWGRKKKEPSWFFLEAE